MQVFISAIIIIIYLVAIAKTQKNNYNRNWNNSFIFINKHYIFNFYKQYTISKW